MRPSLKEICAATATYYDFPLRDLMESSPYLYSRARQLAMFLGRSLAGQSWSKIGRHHDRNHATVMFGYKRVLSRLGDGAGAGETIAAILAISSMATASARARMAQERDMAQALHTEAAKPPPPKKDIPSWILRQSYPRRVMVPAIARTGPKPKAHRIEAAE